MKKPNMSNTIKLLQEALTDGNKRITDMENVIRNINVDRQNAINEINFLRRLTEKLAEALVKGSEAVISNHTNCD